MKIIPNFKVSELTPYKYNNKHHTEKAIDQLIESIHTVGFSDPIEIDKNNVIIAGHKRRLALLKMGVETVDVIKHEDLTASQSKYYRMANNVHSEQSQWDNENFRIEYDELKLEGFEVDKAGFNDFLFDFNIESENAEVEDDDFNPELPEETYIKIGDVVVLGETHRILCGDSTLVESYDKLLQGQKADLLYTDPPYGIDYQGGTKSKREKIANDNIGIYDFYLTFLDLCNLNCIDNASIYLWHADSFSHNAIRALIDSGWLYKQMIIWVKNALCLSRSDYHYKHEQCIYGWKGAPHRFFGDRCQTTVWEFDKPRNSAQHPTMKPLDLCAVGIQNSSQCGDIVLDPFLGSGSTLMACHIADRRCFGFEIEPKYVQVIIERYKSYCEQHNQEFECTINGQPESR